ncbi:hypothetical protein [Bdellovibrio sp. BCCA]|uniref:hypothetical protein n=1 Tax=Bdellovibrio sp. BCCA TaxID=3136281 RepID=UPI0030F232D1
MKTPGFLLLALLSTSSFAVNKDISGRLIQPSFASAPACEERPEFLTEIRNDFVGTVSRLPEAVLVARDVEYYIEGKHGDEAVKLYGYQSFLQQTAASQILCGSTPQAGKERFSLLAPTLIDTRKQPKIGQSLWQFQLMTEGNKYSFWNLKSPALKNKTDLEKWLKSSGAQYKIYQRSHTEFELMLVKKEREVTQYLSIRYDSIPDMRNN